MINPFISALTHLVVLTALILSGGASDDSKIRRRREDRDSNFTLACNTRTFRGVSREVWRCFKDAVTLQEGITFPEGDTGRVSSRAKVDYSVNTTTQTLTITVLSTPWFVGCDAFNGRMEEHLTDCFGPSIRQVANENNNEVWRIDGPNVKQADTVYPQIKFRPRDTVAVDAGGCVQTGGPGKTWRLYVDPIGPDSDKSFHGRIKLPGMRESLTIRQFVSNGNNFEIPSNASGDMQLHLGYEDNPKDYANNGYWGHDDGIANQCRNVGKAWVIIRIYHN